MDLSNWDFSGVKTKDYTHCFHIYPAMMIPQIPRRLIETYLCDKDKVILDPYCGSGTTLVEANLTNRYGIGIDINPLALIIAQAKVTPIDHKELQHHISNFFQITQNLSLTTEGWRPEEAEAYWFPVEVIPALQLIKNFISNLANADVRRFFNVSFSETVRDVSYVNKGGYKRHRMKKIETFHPDAIKLMCHKLKRNASGLKDFVEKLSKSDVKNDFLSCNTVYDVEPLKGRQIDAIITSPPYGDSRTTVAYGEFSSFALQWLGYETKGLDRSLMGGRKRVDDDAPVQFPSYLNDIITTIANEDAVRAKDVTSFYADYQHSIDHVAELLRTGGFAAYVVGNRIVKNQKLPTHQITRSFFEENNCKHIDTFVRSIPTKRMPRANSPSNIAGAAVSTMNEEYIVVMQKC